MTSRTNPQSRAVLISSGAVVWMVLMLAGCGGGGAGGGGTPGAPFAGSVNGGGPQNPIGGSTLTLYAMGSTGSGTGATSLISAVSDSNGRFSFGSYTCPGGNPQTYIIATGGDAGGGDNSAIGLLALMGPCNSLTAATFVTINELTTAAGAWALAQFTDSTGQNLGATSTNGTGLTNAVNLAESNLVVSFLLSGGDTFNTGIVAAFWANNGATTCTGSFPPDNCDGLRQMNTIANIAAACVNSTGPSATLPTCASATSACDVLFACTSTPSTGTTLQATHAMATNPLTNVFRIFTAQGAPATAPFTPFKSSAPDAWTLAIKYTGGGLNLPAGIAIDASGNAWVTNLQQSSVTELSSSGTAISPPSGFIGGGLSFPVGIAIDASGNAWAANAVGDSVTELNSSGGAVSPFSGFPVGVLDSSPLAIAIDFSGNAWVANRDGNSVTELNSSGSAVGTSPFTGGGLNSPVGIAIDVSGNIWAPNQNGNSVTELNSSGSAVGASPFTGGGLSDPQGIAIDASSNAWVTNQNTNSVTELNSAGSAVGASPFTGGGLNLPSAIAIDTSGNVWVTNLGNNTVTELNSAGNPISPAGGFALHFLNGPTAIAIDASGNVWVTDQGGNSVRKLIGAATPVKTPLVASFAFCGKTVCSP